MGVNWGYFKKLKPINDRYLPDTGEGDTMAEQIVTAVNKLIYKWYNDGDTPDNTHYLRGWANDLSTYANWLYEYVPETRNILDAFFKCYNGDDYESKVLQPLCDLIYADQFLTAYEVPSEGSVYDCDGPFVWEEDSYEDEDDWYGDEEYDEDEYDEEE